MQVTRRLGGYPSVEKKSVYSTAPANWAYEGGGVEVNDVLKKDHIEEHQQQQSRFYKAM